MLIDTLDQSLLRWLEQARLGRDSGKVMVGTQTNIIRWMIVSEAHHDEAWEKVITCAELPSWYVIEAMEALTMGLEEPFWRLHLRLIEDSLIQSLFRAKDVWNFHPCLGQKIENALGLLDD